MQPPGSRRIGKVEALAALKQLSDQFTAHNDCAMCWLTSAGRSGHWLAENAAGVVVLDEFGYTYGHVLVVSKVHVETPTELSSLTFLQLQSLVYAATTALEQTLKPHRVYTAMFGASEPLPMTFAHCHTHLVPIYESGEAARPANVFSWNAGVVVYTAQESVQLTARLRSRLSSLM